MLTSDLTELASLISNPVPPRALETATVCGILGDRPSQYAKSPSLWNAAFQSLKLDALFLAWDVEEANLGAVVGCLRQSERILGFSVTVPYKVKILEHLDELDPKARQIGAVNTVARTKDGGWIGYNTDGIGFMKSLPPFFPSLQGLRVLLLGAGGAARSVGFCLAEAIGSGEIIVSNRSKQKAQSLAGEISNFYKNARGIGEEEISAVLPKVDLVVNCTTKGQGGLRQLPGGKVTLLEPYSSLAPASPGVFTAAEEASQGPAFTRRWLESSWADIEENRRRSVERILKTAPRAVAYDLIYSPLESVFLRQARWAGLRTSNGKWMNIAQAADALTEKVCRDLLRRRGGDPAQIERSVFETMAAIW